MKAFHTKFSVCMTFFVGKTEQTIALKRLMHSFAQDELNLWNM